MLILDIAQIPPEGLEIDASLSPAEVHLEGDAGCELEPGGRFAGRVERGEEDSVHVRGRVSARLAVECGRCLERYGLPLDHELDLFFLPHQAGTDEAEDEVELSDRDMVVAFYEGERLDLGQVLREQFLLSMPMKKLCREDCLGLCPACGANRNERACGCPPAEGETADPRLAILGQLFKRGSDEGRH
jgi:uncharacterized protein